jgi:hypothetical protein
MVRQSVAINDSPFSDKIQFEWDSDSSHHFTGSDGHFIPGSFVRKSMAVIVANGEKCYTLGYGALNHPMLTKVWYIKRFPSNLFSDVQAMKDGYSCRRVGNRLEYFRGDTTVLTGVFESNRWILNFDLSRLASQNTLPIAGHANGTGMGLLPVSAQVTLMHRRCNHVSASLLYLAIDKKLTSGLCAKKPSASLCNFSVIDCLACTLAKSKVAAHRTRSMELLSVGKERQRVPGHITPRGLHSGVAPYEFLALDLKTDLQRLGMVVQYV